MSKQVCGGRIQWHVGSNGTNEHSSVLMQRQLTSEVGAEMFFGHPKRFMMKG